MKKLLLLLIPLVFLFGCTSEEMGTLENKDSTTASTKEVSPHDATTTSTTMASTTAPTTTVASTTTRTTSRSTTKSSTTKASNVGTNNKQGRTVYKTPTGKKYHYDNHCNGGTYIETTLDDALSLGLEPCKKCVLN